MSERIDVLAFGAHPDDVEIFCGGTLIRLADLGYRVAVVDLSRGERASNGTPELRAEEAAKAAEVLGLAHRENLGLPDAYLGEEPPEGPGRASQLSSMVAALRRLRPELVLLPWIEERHPDHVAAGVLLTRAVYLAGVKNFEPTLERHVTKQTLYYQQRFRMAPTFVMDTSEAAGRKAQAIACYSSQVSRSAGDAPTLVNSGRALEAIDARDRYFGSLIGTSHGEALRASSVPGLVDPVRHYRDNPFHEAHAFEPLR